MDKAGSFKSLNSPTQAYSSKSANERNLNLIEKLQRDIRGGPEPEEFTSANVDFEMAVDGVNYWTIVENDPNGVQQ